MKKFYLKFKRKIFSILSIRMVYKGYNIKAAIKWKRSVLADFVKNFKVSIFYKIKSYKMGFIPYQRQLFGVNSNNKDQFISYKDYLYLRGINGKYSKWLNDIVTTDSVLKKFRDNLIEIYYQIYLRDDELRIISLHEDINVNQNDIINFIKKKKKLCLMTTNFSKKYLLTYKSNKLYIDDVVITPDEFFKLIKESLTYKNSFVLAEYLENNDLVLNNKPAKLYLSVYNKNGVDPLIGEIYTFNEDYTPLNKVFEDDDSTIIQKYSYKRSKHSFKDGVNIYRMYFNEKTGTFNSYIAMSSSNLYIMKHNKCDDNIIKIVKDNYSKISNLITEIFKTIPQIELAGVEIIIDKGNIKITKIENNPDYCDAVYYNSDFTEYLKYKYTQKKELYGNCNFRFSRFKQKVYSKFCRIFAKLFYPRGLVPYISMKWLNDIKEDYTENKNIPFRTKMWAYRHGFLSYRLAQYNITKDNYKNFITDFEYKWLRHINNYYKSWFEDKVTIKYIASNYNKFFPEYYYFISLKQGENSVIPLMDSPKNAKGSYDEIFELVKKKKDVALKRDKGSHGEGFYRLSYHDNKFYLNLEETTKKEVIEILSDKSNEYLVTEYIKQHDVLNKIYDGSVNTIRIIVFKKDGENPTIGNTYMRFGSKKTGTVDNIGAGGIFVEVDPETGFFHDALIITDDRKIVPCKKHPDTNVDIEGYIPNWDKIKKDILEIAKSLKQIEYFGFDISVTENGMKFPEINRYPDYMKIGKLKQHSIDYLFERLEAKKARLGYKNKMPHKLFKFLDRREKK